MITLADIHAARARIRGIIYESPCAYSETTSQLTGARVFFKLDNLQMTGSFKERGALNKLLSLTEDERQRGVIAASAGNHGLAVAFHAHRLGIPAAIVMPRFAPLVKVSSARRYGAEVILAGADFDEALAEALRLQRERGSVFIPAFNDPAVIAGQGTLGLELLEQTPDFAAVIAPVGGGGLIGGVALALKESGFLGRVIGVQAERIASMQAALAAGAPTSLPPATTIADGIAVRRVGDLTLPLVQQYVDEIVTVSEAELAHAILVLLENEKTVVEGAAATTLAALLSRPLHLAGQAVVLILSGGNIDVNVIARVIEKGLVQEGRLTRLSLIVTDRPGALARVSTLVADQGANIQEIVHTRGFSRAEIGESEITLTLETLGPQHIAEVIAALRAAGYQVFQERPGP
ncbi:MAG TPA: threonine ammonia-lyase [Methylomirabilota bacterium]|jgi:threonine dehydratase|nr:threonine ammonia-lyase [Methylomirabilota bacterium]